MRAHVPAPHPGLPIWLAVACSVICGALNAVQSRVNGELGHRIGDGFTAAVISFGSGLLILGVVMILIPAGRRGLGRIGDAVRERTLSWWHLTGGVAGGFYVLSQSLTAAVLGLALFTVALVAGQTVAGLGMDRLGVGPSGRHHLTLARILGAIVVLVAVAWAVSGEIQADVPLWLLWMPLVAGIGQGWQQAVNGRVRVTSQSALTATFINFVTGTAVLTVAVVVHGLLAGFPTALPTEPWLYIGGAVGCVFIAGAAAVVHTTGVLVLGLSIVTGQLVCAIGLDLLAPSAAHPLTASTLVGAALALVAVIIASVRWRSFGGRGRQRRG